MNKEQFDFLDFITIMSFLVGIESLQQTDETLITLMRHNEKMDLVLKRQGEIIDELERKRTS